MKVYIENEHKIGVAYNGEVYLIRRYATDDDIKGLIPIEEERDVDIIKFGVYQCNGLIDGWQQVNSFNELDLDTLLALRRGLKVIQRKVGLNVGEEIKRISEIIFEKMSDKAYYKYEWSKKLDIEEQKNIIEKFKTIANEIIRKFGLNYYDVEYFSICLDERRAFLRVNEKGERYRNYQFSIELLPDGNYSFNLWATDIYRGKGSG